MNKRILLVEDNPDDTALAQRAFRKRCAEVELVTADSAERALEVLASAARPPRLILLDLQLPRMSGLDLLRHLRSEPATATLPVTVLTSSDEEQDIRAAYALGANSFLRKPVDFGDFVTLVGQVSQYWLELNQVTRHG